jgi:hypothetical protein
MEMPTMKRETEQNESRLQLLEPENRSERNLESVIDQVTVLAESFGEPLTPQRLEIYVHELSDIDHEKLAVACSRARRDLKFFPKIAELRTLARTVTAENAEEKKKVEANDAWEFVNKYLRKWGVARYDDDRRPRLPARVDYALRRIGGLSGLNQITAQSRPFMYRDFVEAYQLAPVAQSMGSLLEGLFGTTALMGDVVKQLPTAPGEPCSSDVHSPRCRDGERGDSGTSAERLTDVPNL